MEARKGEQPPPSVQLADYRPPDFLVDSVALEFDLAEPVTRVRSRIAFRRNPNGKSSAPLNLDGDGIELVSLAIDGEPVESGRYTLDEKNLSVRKIPDTFTAAIETAIRPRENTRLSGLYTSGSAYCTQCEAEGFRKITYYLDRPDVMSRFTTTVIAERERYPVLLSNGNPIASGEHEGGRHWVSWEDPFPKPAYLFALVAGDLCLLQDSFTTMSGRTIDLRIYVEPENRTQCDHAMDSLKRSMRWDEEVYGREYDLDIFMIVAVNDFNMGAMENKGLNIFNSSCVLAHQDTATDMAFQRVEAVVAHEYFHNWSGNRVTCRDWFQLSLKEGFTVFRDSEFSADMNSRTVKRIEDVTFLRANQFAEDAGPMAHPVRPDSFIEISNFYTLTVYEKGAEVVRMLHTLLGEEGFRKGTDLYFERHDGQAVTCDDFIKALEDANGADFTQFKRWYSQAGTPRLNVRSEYDAASREYRLHFSQVCPPTPGQPEKQPQVIPVRMALLDRDGNEIPLQLEGKALGNEAVVSITEAEQTLVFENVPNCPLPSLLRGFSAPVKLSYPYSRDDRVFLAKHDPDGFNRWEAAQGLAVDVLQGLVEIHRAGRPLNLDQRLVEVMRSVIADAELDAAMVAEIIRLPSEAYLIELAEVADVDAIHYTREWLRRALAEALRDEMSARYQILAAAGSGAFSAKADAMAARSLKNSLLSYLMLTGEQQVVGWCVRQFVEATNMTDRQAALVALVNSPFEQQREAALAEFAERWAEYPLVMDQWFSIQAAASQPGALERVRKLMEHPLFTMRNPNKVRALIGAFANQNLINFHALDGSGYAFLADRIIELDRSNPQIASRLLTPLSRWRKFDPKRQDLMKAELARIMAQSPLSPDVYEVVSKSLA